MPVCVFSLYPVPVSFFSHINSHKEKAEHRVHSTSEEKHSYYFPASNREEEGLWEQGGPRLVGSGGTWEASVPSLRPPPLPIIFGS